MSSLKDRISKVIDDLKLSKNQFAISIGTSSAMISKITKSDVNFGVDILEKIISEYPSLNPGWLLTGIGEPWLKMPSNFTSLDTSLSKKDTTGSTELQSEDQAVVKINLSALNKMIEYKIWVIEFLITDIEYRLRELLGTKEPDINKQKWEELMSIIRGDKYLLETPKYIGFDAQKKIEVLSLLDEYTKVHLELIWRLTRIMLENSK